MHSSDLLPLTAGQSKNGQFATTGSAEEHLANLSGILKELTSRSIILVEDLNRLTPDVRNQLREHSKDKTILLDLLIEHGLITPYQAERIRNDKWYGLILGNYRVLDQIGEGGMGIVFKAEHLYMRRPVAIKVLTRAIDKNSIVLQRFFSEMRAVGRLLHPNIVTAFDAGRLESRNPYEGEIYYYVMEYIEGTDLEQYLAQHGPLSVTAACDIAYQIASALVEAHKHELVHRDIKPSNVLITADRQAKLLDFGLALTLNNRVTDPGTILGTLDYLAPEQARDASSVDIRADIYSLGGVFYWCLTGRDPFPSSGHLVHDLTRRLSQPAPSVRNVRPDIPEQIDAIIQKMMATDPADRFATPAEVQEALLPHLRPNLREHSPQVRPTQPLPPTSSDNGNGTAIATGSDGTKVVRPSGSNTSRVLIVDDERGIRELCKFTLLSEKIHCREAEGGEEALEILRGEPYDLVLLDVNMPDMTGIDVAREVRKLYPGSHLKIILFSGQQSPDEMASLLANGIDDFLTKPFSVVQLRSRVLAALRLKQTQDHMDWLNKHLGAVNRQLEESLQSQQKELIATRDSLVLALARTAEYREDASGKHLERMPLYCTALAEEAGKLPEFAARIDDAFIDNLRLCAPLHDIGKISLPDQLLTKRDSLSDTDRMWMQAHTTAGADLIKSLMARHEGTLAFLHMAVHIAQYHHERYDGTGYPEGLAGNAIPLPARIVAIADVYDALRQKHPYKPALSHAAAVHVITKGSDGQFDPLLLTAFERCESEFDRIFQEVR